MSFTFEYNPGFYISVFSGGTLNSSTSFGSSVSHSVTLLHLYPPINDATPRTASDSHPISWPIFWVTHDVKMDLPCDNNGLHTGIMARRDVEEFTHLWYGDPLSRSVVVTIKMCRRVEQKALFFPGLFGTYKLHSSDSKAIHSDPPEWDGAICWWRMEEVEWQIWSMHHRSHIPGSRRTRWVEMWCRK